MKENGLRLQVSTARRSLGILFRQAEAAHERGEMSRLCCMMQEYAEVMEQTRRWARDLVKKAGLNPEAIGYLKHPVRGALGIDVWRVVDSDYFLPSPTRGRPRSRPS